MSKSQNHRAKSAGSSFADGIGKWFLNLKGKYQDYNDKFFEDLDQLTLDEAIQRYRGYQRLLLVIRITPSRGCYLKLGETNIDNTYSNKQKTCVINAEYRDEQQVVKHAKDKY